jgi:Zn-dependent alcohol dehydrogenase
MVEVKAAVVREKGGHFLIEQLQLDEPRHNELLIKIVATGVRYSAVTGSRAHAVHSDASMGR